MLSPIALTLRSVSQALRQVSVVTSSRADLSHLIWPLRALRAEPSVQLSILACGGAIAPEYGDAVARLEREGCAVSRIGRPLGIDSATDLGISIGELTAAFSKWLGARSCDLLILTADRAEMLAPATAALCSRIPILHIEGGERSEGAIDNAVRDALTMVSHVHCVTTARAHQRVLSLGESPWRVHTIGAASLDHLTHGIHEHDGEAALLAHGLHPTRPLLLVAVHPVTLAADPCGDARVLLDALSHLTGEMARREVQVLFAFPNADVGGREIRRMCQAWTQGHGGALAVQLEAEAWFALLRRSSTIGLIGNSSSVVMEAPAAHLPSILIGERQRGRELGPGTAWVRARSAGPFDSPTTESVASALEALLDSKRVEVSASWIGTHPYGDGRASERLLRVIQTLPGRDCLLDKRLPDECAVMNKKGLERERSSPSVAK